jgi:ribose transport system substrate-binding protein
MMRRKYPVHSKGVRRTNQLSFLIGLAVITSLAVGCSSSSSGSSSSSSGSSSSSSGSGSQASANTKTSSCNSQEVTTALAAAKAAEAPATKISQTAPLAQKPPTGKFLVWLADPVPANAQIAASAQIAAAAIGWKFKKIPYNPGSPATIQAALSSALSMKASVVAESGVPTNQFGASEIAAYQKAGVPILETNVVPGVNSPDIWGTPASVYETPGAQALASWVIADSCGKANVLIEDAAVFPILTQFDDSFAADLKAGCSGCTVQSIVVPPDDITNGQLIPAVVARLRQDSSIGYVSFDNGAFADGVRSQLNAAGLSKVKVIGTGMDADGAAGIKAGTESAWMSVSYYYQGDSIVDAAIRALGNESGISGDTFAPQQLLDSNNIAQFGSGNYPPAKALQQFEPLWKVPVTTCSLGC